MLSTVTKMITWQTEIQLACIRLHILKWSWQWWIIFVTN